MPSPQRHSERTGLSARGVPWIFNLIGDGIGPPVLTGDDGVELLSLDLPDMRAERPRAALRAQRTNRPNRRLALEVRSGPIESMPIFDSRRVSGFQNQINEIIGTQVENQCEVPGRRFNEENVSRGSSTRHTSS